MRTLLASRRQALVLTLAVSVSVGVGFTAYSLGSAAGANSSYLPRVVPATASSTVTDSGAPATSSTAEAAASSPLTLDQATTVAVEAAAPGRVVKWDEDHEPTGLRYDITLLHDDGSTTDVEVDTVTGQVTSLDHDTDGD